MSCRLRSRGARSYQPCEQISIDAAGRPAIDRGHVRPQDELTSAADEVLPENEAGAAENPAHAAPAHRAVITIGEEKPDDAGNDDAIEPLPEWLVGEMTAHRTLALRDALARKASPRYTKRFAFYVSRRCRQASIGDITTELRLDLETVKTLEMQYMQAQLVRADRHEGDRHRRGLDPQGLGFPRGYTASVR